MAASSIVSAFLGTFTPLRQRNFRVYMSGQVMSMIGTWLQVTAQGWVVWQLTGSSAALGVTTMLSTLPILALGPLVGSIIDRYDRRKILIISQTVAMILAFILALLTYTESIQLWHVYALSLVLGVVTAFDFPAQMAFLGDIAGVGQIRQAVTFNAMVIQLSRSLGPALAGVVLAALGAAMAFLLNGISFLFVIASLLLVRSAQVRSGIKTPDSAAAQPTGSFRDAIRFVASQPRLLDLMLFVSLLTFFVLAVVLNMLPAVADEVLGGDETTLSALMSASGFGALFGALFIVPFAQTVRRTGLVVTCCVIWTGATLVLAAIGSTLPIWLVALFLGSAASPVTFTTATSYMQMIAPPDMRGRLMGLNFMISFGMQPVAALLVGFLGDHLGIAQAVLINGVMTITIASALLIVRAPLRQWHSGISSDAAKAVSPSAH
jgi:MFS family permease